MSETPIDGIYAVYLTGQSGNGFILLIMMDGKVTGADPMGTTFDGAYSATTNGNGYQAKVSVKIQPNATTIQGVSAGPSGLEYEVSYVLTKNFDEQDFLEIETPLGPVNARFKKLRRLSND